ncbi:RNase adapter RapZ [Gymnodinialimonas sp. 2305UL16-5]|uniref:RNase adapter RapZ n=1 Tax=Gymnodinialimonas mytili TaxID=3126503 RepID=UPI0030A4B9F3
MTDAQSPAQVIFVTGLSGAGRSTIINVLEDLGFEAIDNLPLSLLSRLLEGAPPARPLALGIDSRTRDFSADELMQAFARLQADPAFEAEMIYVDCDTATLQQRYSETRRRHPLAPDADPMAGIALDRDMVGALRDVATILLDTSRLTPHDTKARIAAMFPDDQAPGLAVQLTSFSFKRGLPLGADLVFDCRFLRNPHWDPLLRPQDGRSPDVQAHIRDDPRFAPFCDQVAGLLDLLLPAYREEGKSHLTVAFGCTGGRHRSVALVEITAQHLAEQGWRVSKRHRDVARTDPQSHAPASHQTPASPSVEDEEAS